MPGNLWKQWLKLTPHLYGTSCAWHDDVKPKKIPRFQLMALDDGNPLVTGGFPLQRPLTRSFDVIYVMPLCKRLSNRPRRQWYETPSRSHHDVTAMAVEEISNGNISSHIDIREDTTCHRRLWTHKWDAIGNVSPIKWLHCVYQTRLIRLLSKFIFDWNSLNEGWNILSFDVAANFRG